MKLFGAGTESAPGRGPPRRLRRGDRLAQLGAADDRRAAREGRARRLLDLHLHQLAANPCRTSVPGPSRYADDGLVVVGVHTPEFALRARRRQRPPGRREMRRRLPGRDRQPTTRSGSAFANSYWPAVYIADAEGRIRHHQFGEGGYEECELVIQQLLTRSRPRGRGEARRRSRPKASRCRRTGRPSSRPRRTSATSRRRTSPLHAVRAATTRCRIAWGSTSGRSPETGPSAPARSG